MTESKKNVAPPEDNSSELENIIEAGLFASHEPLSIRTLKSMFSRDAQPSTEEIRKAIEALQEKYQHRGVELRKIGNGWRFQTRLKYALWLRKLHQQKPPRFSRALLETLSIIAYRQPVTRGDIEEIRGVGVSSETMRILVDREWVQQIGQREVPGRPALFATTSFFLEYFNLASLKDLPELSAKRELGAIAGELNLSLPFEESDEVKPEQDSDSDNNIAEVIELSTPSAAISRSEKE